MASDTKIEWTDATWNVVTGCDKVSPGCDRCYAETFAERWRGIPGHHFENGFDITLRPERLTLPLRWRKPKRVFVNSMSDLFHKDIPVDYIARVFAVMALTPQHTYQVLTKRHGRMRSLIGDPTFEKQVDHELLHFPPFADPKLTRRSWPLPKAGWPLPNVWLGVSVEDQKRADLRIPALIDTPAAVRFLSCEPLLGPVDLDGPIVPGRGRPKLTYWLTGRPAPGPERTTPTGLTMHSPAIVTGPRIDWVITGGESGHGARPAHPDWFRTIRDQCQEAGVAYLHKQHGEWASLKSMHEYVTDDDRVQILNVNGELCGRPWFGWNRDEDQQGSVVVRRYGKKEAGRELDGRTWDEFPEVTR
ncbi:phage Gp37Gp68 [Streptomyces himastatinicus ATCC 53653]|uniref:Phage Gp37Gp68 n=1 Tax=Streptomyces himastatinicus ATCC 53653 TaxID=457427 RepID=D9WWZ2_9ACTN|nr:phage Gp37/Gp68 family protein [Streptomyces himastatinicus]EFL29420.1 phage Gp37Gp68 [Streptomyces himastatinicus ATCC 53653]